MDELLQVFPDVPSATTPFSADGWGVVDLLASSGVTSSKGEATRLVRSGGIYVNGRRIVDEKHRLLSSEADRRSALRDSEGKTRQLPGPDCPRLTSERARLYPELSSSDGCQPGSG